MSSKLENKIDKLIDTLGKVAPIAPVAPVAPVLPLAPINYSADHDLIIKLDTKIDALKEDIKAINDGTSTKISDHESRIRRLELWGFLALGFLYAVQFYLTFIKK